MNFLAAEVSRPEIYITQVAFSFARETGEIGAEAATDGLYVARTSLSEATAGDAETVRSYNSSALVERAFRYVKADELHMLRLNYGHTFRKIRKS